MLSAKPVEKCSRKSQASKYNSIRSNLKVWLEGDSPTCDSQGRDGWYSLYSGPNSNECYTMTDYYDFPHEIPCSWEHSTYGLLCYDNAPNQVCEHTFDAAGSRYTVYSPRQETVNGDAFCQARGKTWAQVYDAATYDAIKVNLKVWANGDSRTCEPEGRTGWYTLYRGPSSNQCYTMTDFYDFPHSINCSWNHFDYGVLCMHWWSEKKELLKMNTGGLPPHFEVVLYNF